MKVTVTEQDITTGHQFDQDQCAVARALSRAGVAHLGVMGPSVMICDESGRMIPVALPPPVRHWILDFDSGKHVGPISFDFGAPPLPPPPELEEMPLARTAQPGRGESIPVTAG